MNIFSYWLLHRYLFTLFFGALFLPLVLLIQPVFADDCEPNEEGDTSWCHDISVPTDPPEVPTEPSLEELRPAEDAVEQEDDEDERIYFKSENEGLPMIRDLFDKFPPEIKNVYSKQVEDNQVRVNTLVQLKTEIDYYGEDLTCNWYINGAFTSNKTKCENEFYVNEQDAAFGRIELSVVAVDSHGVSKPYEMYLIVVDSSRRGSGGDADSESDSGPCDYSAYTRQAYHKCIKEVSQSLREPVSKKPLNDVMVCLMYEESRNYDASVGACGEIGIFQFTGGTWDWFGREFKLLEKGADNGSINGGYGYPGPEPEIDYAACKDPTTGKVPNPLPKTFKQMFGANIDADGWNPYNQIFATKEALLKGRGPNTWSTWRLCMKKLGA